MRRSYDFSTSVRNPYAKRLKKQITIRLDEETIRYFKALGKEKGYPVSESYQFVSQRLRRIA